MPPSAVQLDSHMASALHSSWGSQCFHQLITGNSRNMMATPFLRNASHAWLETYRVQHSLWLSGLSLFVSCLFHDSSLPWRSLAFSASLRYPTHKEPKHVVSSSSLMLPQEDCSSEITPYSKIQFLNQITENNIVFNFPSNVYSIFWLFMLFMILLSSNLVISVTRESRVIWHSLKTGNFAQSSFHQTPNKP